MPIYLDMHGPNFSAACLGTADIGFQPRFEAAGFPLLSKRRYQLTDLNY